MEEEDDGRGESRVLRAERAAAALQQKENDFNTYATSKSVSQEFLDASNIQAQIALLIGMFASRESSLPLNGFEITLTVLGAVCLVACLLFGCHCSY
jgi:hypothetical protein